MASICMQMVTEMVNVMFMELVTDMVTGIISEVELEIAL